MNRNANWAPILFKREDFHQEDGHSSDLDQKRSDILFDDQIQWKRTPSFLFHESIYPEER